MKTLFPVFLESYIYFFLAGTMVMFEPLSDLSLFLGKRIPIACQHLSRVPQILRFSRNTAPKKSKIPCWRELVKIMWLLCLISGKMHVASKLYNIKKVYSGSSIVRSFRSILLTLPIIYNVNIILYEFDGTISQANLCLYIDG